MKLSVSDVIRRGFDNVLSNWQLLVIRIAESVLWLIILVMTFIAAAGPIVVTVIREAGLDREHPERIPEALALLFTEHWLLIAYLVVLAVVLLTVLTATHAFVEGGTVRVLLDTDAKGGGAAFDGERWFTGGRTTWWRIFWIYSIVALAAGVVVLIPLIVLALVVNLGGSAAIALSCVFAPIAVFTLLATSIVAALWNQKSIIVCVDRDLGATESTRVAWAELKADFPRHLGVAAICVVAGFVVSIVVSSFTFGGVVLGHHTPLQFVFAPMQMVASVAHSAVSAFASIWFTACFAALRGDNRG